MKKIFSRIVAALSMALFIGTTPVMEAKAAFGQNENGYYYVDDITGQYVMNNWVNDANGNTYFMKADGYMLYGSWLYLPDGNWYFANTDGTILKSGTWTISEASAYYDAATGEYLLNTIAGGDYYFNESGIAGTADSNAGSSSSAFQEEVYSFTDEEIFAYAAQYVPDWVGYARPVYIWNWGIGYDVRFSTEYGLYKVYLARDLFSEVLYGSGVNSLYCQESGFLNY